MFAYPAQPLRQRPPFDGRELHVHPHRSSRAVSRTELELVVVFLTRYSVWCAKARRYDRLRNAIDLLVEVAAS
jgi:hypothetical protein